MKRKAQFSMLMLVISLLAFNAFAIQRFPKPEFESGYKIPATQVTRVQPVIYEYLDLIVFIGCMSLITWLILKKRSRKAVFWISVFALLYFGFYRKGCICPVGSLQNITMALFNPEYNIPLHSDCVFCNSAWLYPVFWPYFLCRSLSAWSHSRICLHFVRLA